MEYKLYHNFITNKIILLLITDTLENGIILKNIMTNSYMLNLLDGDCTILLNIKKDNTFYEYSEESDKFVNIFMSSEFEAFEYAKEE